MGKSDWQPCKDLRLKSSPLKTTTPQNIEYMIYYVIHDMYNNVCNVWEGQSGNLAQTWVLWKPSLQKMIHPSPRVIPTNWNVQQQQQKPKPWLKVKKSTAGSCRLDFICIFCLSCSVTTWKRRTLAIIILIKCWLFTYHGIGIGRMFQLVGKISWNPVQSRSCGRFAAHWWFLLIDHRLAIVLDPPPASLR